MTSRKSSDRFKVPPGVTDIVYGVIRDYRRRCEELTSSIVSEESKEMFYKLNGAVESALLLVEDGVRDVFIYDMSHKVGYYHSKAMDFMNHKSYHLRKRKLIYSIAKILSLV
jgi:hypothetical protein